MYFPIDVLNVVATAMVTACAGVLTGYISKKQRQIAENEKEEVKEIVEALQVSESAKKTASIENLLNKLPQGLSPEDFYKKLDQLASQLSTQAISTNNGHDAVEGLINGYHGQALNQARVQFWFSVVAATIGFIWILSAGLEIQANNLMTAGKILPGIVIDAVAFLFFKQASETRQRATDLYDRLRRDKQMNESVALVSSIEDIKVRSAVKAQIALHMSGLEPAPINLSSFLSTDGEQNK